MGGACKSWGAYGVVRYARKGKEKKGKGRKGNMFTHFKGKVIFGGRIKSSERI